MRTSVRILFLGSEGCFPLTQFRSTATVQVLRVLCDLAHSAVPKDRVRGDGLLPNQLRSLGWPSGALALLTRLIRAIDQALEAHDP